MPPEAFFMQAVCYSYVTQCGKNVGISTFLKELCYDSGKSFMLELRDKRWNFNVCNVLETLKTR